VPGSAPGQSDLDPQSDAGAGKGAVLAKIATSPKEGSPYLGPKEALVVVNVFSDFQCPVCRRSADPIKQLVLDFPGKVKVVFRNNALEMHGRSRPAALAAMAAGKQGRFWEYHDRLFANAGALDDASLRQTAQELGLDLAQWEKDLADPRNSDRLKEEAGWAAKLGARGTPGFFVNGIRNVGWGSYQGLKSSVTREIAASERLEASGIPRARIPAERIRAMADKNPKAESDGPINADLWVKALTSD
jgi:protein-disulfide isomerase